MEEKREREEVHLRGWRRDFRLKETFGGGREVYGHLIGVVRRRRPERRMKWSVGMERLRKGFFLLHA